MSSVLCKQTGSPHMISTIWTFIQQYIYVPSATYVALTLFVYMMWLFGTDWYDRFKKAWYNSLDFMKGYFWFTLIFNAIGYMFTEYFIYGWAVWNVWCSLILFVYSVRVVYDLLHSFNAWCLHKRGKI
jgi:uncharacterized protein YybS (DUF2232 family)